MSVVPAEGFTVMRISLDRAHIQDRLPERETKGAVVLKIARIWMTAAGLNLIQGFLFWDYDESTVAFTKCSDVSTELWRGVLIIYFGAYWRMKGGIFEFC